MVATRKLCLEGDALEAVCSIVSVTPNGDGTLDAVLDATPFHPRGGGQPSDAGTIGEARVLAVAEDHEGVVHHTIDRELPPGPCVSAVDVAARALNTRLHSAGHIVSVAVESQGLWKAVKGNHFPGESRVVFVQAAEGPRPAFPCASDLEARVAEVVKAALPRRIELDSDGRRHVTWGSLPGYMCGGTHVASTDLLGRVRIGRIKFRSGELRVNYSLED